MSIKIKIKISNKHMNALELFSGTQSFGKVLKKKKIIMLYQLILQIIKVNIYQLIN